jgi:phage head maturation protease
MSRKRQRQRPSPVTAQRDTPRAFRVVSQAGCAITAAAGGQLPSFAGTAYTGQPMRPEGWWRDVVIDLAGVRVPSQHRPALRQHDHEQIVGHTTEVKVDKGGIHVQGVFSGEDEHRNKVIVPAKNGFQWQLSVGANPVRTEQLEAGEETQVNGRAVVGPLTISRETEIGEISFVPLGADGDTSVSVAAQRGTGMNHWHQALKELSAELRAKGAKCFTDAEVDNMTGDDARKHLKKHMEVARAGKDGDDDEDDEDEEGGKAEAQKGILKFRAEADKVLEDLRVKAAAEEQRHGAIRAAARKHGVTEVEVDGKKVGLVAHAIAQGWSRGEGRAGGAPRRPARGRRRPARRPGLLTSTPQASEAVLEAAVLQAARHQFRLDHDDFYCEPTPDGQGSVRRVPAHVQARRSAS